MFSFSGNKRDLTSFCFHSKNYNGVYPLRNNKYNHPIKLWCAICRLYKARAMYKFSEGFVSKSWFAEKGRNLTSLSQGKDAGFFLLKHFIWFLIYFFNCYILYILNEIIFYSKKYNVVFNKNSPTTCHQNKSSYFSMLKNASLINLRYLKLQGTYQVIFGVNFFLYRFSL